MAIKFCYKKEELIIFHSNQFNDQFQSVYSFPELMQRAGLGLPLATPSVGDAGN